LLTSADRPAATRTQIIAELAAFPLPLLLYVATLAPTVPLEDSGEFITAAYHLGVPYPSGQRLGPLAAHAFASPHSGPVAERVHLLRRTFS